MPKARLPPGAERRGVTRPICLVTGATGALGPAVVTALGATHDVHTLSRRPPAEGLFPFGVTTYTDDVSRIDEVRPAVRAADVIVHLAALLHITSPAATLRREYERINVGGTAAVLEAAQAEGVRRVVLMSTIAVYGGTGGRLIDETTLVSPDTFYGETKAAAERLAMSARRPDGRALAVVLRAAAVYGPRVKGNYQRLVHALARRRFVPIGSGDNRRTLVFQDDLASAIALAADHPDAAGRVYNVTDGATHTMRDIIAAICGALGRPAPRFRLPVAPVRAAAAVGGMFNGRLPRALDTYLEDVAVSGRRLEDELGFRPQSSLQQGWNRTVVAMRRDGLI